MKHRVAGRKLGRTSAHRLALLRNLSTALFDKERITTTLMKAKELRPFAEKLVTWSKKETLHARRRVLRHIHDREVVAKLFDTLSARFAQRPGGYTRILHLGPRRGDGAEMAIIELVGSEALSKKKKGAAAKGKAGKSRETAPPEEKKAKAAEAEKPAGRKGLFAKKSKATDEKPAKKKAKPAAKQSPKKATPKTKGKKKPAGPD